MKYRLKRFIGMAILLALVCASAWIWHLLLLLNTQSFGMSLLGRWSPPVEPSLNRMDTRTFAWLRDAVMSYKSPSEEMTLQGDDPQDDAEALKQNLQYLDKLSRVPWPDTARLEFIQLRYPDPEMEPRHGWLIRSGLRVVWVMNGDFGIEHYVKSLPGLPGDDDTIKEENFNQWVKELLSTPPQNEVVRGRGGFSGATLSGTELFRVAMVAARLGQKGTIERLVHLACNKERVVTKWLYREAAELAWVDAFRALNEGAPRSWVARRLGKWLSYYPDHPLHPKVAGLRKPVSKIASEDRHHPWPPPPWASVDAKANYYTYKLRDVAERQFSNPGRCNVTASRQARRLMALGKNAIPPLIAALPDSRPTRSYGYSRSFWPESYHVLRIGDAAVQIIEAITHQPFYQESCTGCYLHNEPSQKRDAVIRSIRDWWAKNALRSERDWLTDLFASREAWVRANAIADLRERVGKPAIKDIKPLLKDVDPTVRIAAAKALWELGDRDGLPVALELAKSMDFNPKDPENRFDMEDLSADLTSFLPRTRDPVANLATLAVVLRGHNYWTIDTGEEFSHLSTWCVNYLAPLLDDARATDIHAGSSDNPSLRVCDTAASAITRILHGELSEFRPTPSIQSRDSQIAAIKVWWRVNASRYPVPKKIQSIAPEFGLGPTKSGIEGHSLEK